MKRIRKRYETANQIRDDIDRFKSKQKRHMDKAAALDLQADIFVKQGSNCSEDIVWHREQDKKCRKSAQRIETGRLVKLKEKLAEFCTETLPGVLPDRDKSIQR